MYPDFYKRFFVDSFNDTNETATIKDNDMITFADIEKMIGEIAEYDAFLIKCRKNEINIPEKFLDMISKRYVEIHETIKDYITEYPEESGNVMCLITRHIINISF